jgi:hypothetical protein
MQIQVLKSTLLRLAMVSITLCIIYFNLALYIKHFIPSIPSPPVPLVANELFFTYGVFGGYPRNNAELFIWARLVDVADPRMSRWITIDLDRYLPYFRGEQFGRLWHRRELRYGGRPGQLKAMTDMGKRIRNRHNREFPYLKVGELNIGLYYWPLSPAGFSTLKTPKLTTSRLMVKVPPDVE